MSAERDALAAEIAGCRRCRPELNVRGETESAPGYGSETSPVMLVGQSLCKLCMKYGEPFRGARAGAASRGLRRITPFASRDCSTCWKETTAEISRRCPTS